MTDHQAHRSDAHLIDLFERCEAAKDEWTRLLEHDWRDMRETLRAETCEARRRYAELRDLVLNTPAESVVGVMLKLALLPWDMVKRDINSSLESIWSPVHAAYGDALRLAGLTPKPTRH